MKAPEKIYTDENGNNSLPKRHCDSDIEYIRKDAFVEKAQSFFRSSHYLFHLDGMDLHNFIEDFKKYIGE